MPRAPKKCAEPACETRVTGVSHCAEHQRKPWDGSTRGPATAHRSWRDLRAQILTRDHGVCHVCGRPGADRVDHLRNVAAGGTDAATNLAAIHQVPCHAAKTQREAAAGRWPARG